MYRCTYVQVQGCTDVHRLDAGAATIDETLMRTERFDESANESCDRKSFFRDGRTPSARRTGTR